MSIYIDLTNAERSDVSCARFLFPDGQPHVSLDANALASAVRSATTRASIEVVCRITSALSLVETALVVESVFSVLDAEKLKADVSLNIAYLLSARMDRRIAPGQPATLAVFGALLNAFTSRLKAVRVLDPHSPVALEALRGAEALHPDHFVRFALSRIAAHHGHESVVVIPDKGAIARTSGILERLSAKNAVARCSKKRDPNTGKLSGFALDEGDVRGRACVIVDDICDGGGTFSGIAEVLRAHGAASVVLCVTHGVLSKGVEIAGIDQIYCTDSYGLVAAPECSVVVEGYGDLELALYLREGRERLCVMTNGVRTALEAR